MLLMFYGCADDSKDSSNINNSSITSESDNSSSSSGDEIINPDENTGSTGSSDDISSLPNIPPLEAETQRYIILNANGGIGGYDGYAYKIMDINNKTNIPLNTFTNNGYEFLGWSENKDAVDPEYLDGDLYAVTGNVILYAVWGKSEEND